MWLKCQYIKNTDKNKFYLIVVGNILAVGQIKQQNTTYTHVNQSKPIETKKTINYYKC
jgi:hypothetical protein